VDEWWKEVDRTEEDDKKQSRHAEFNEREIEEMEKSRKLVLLNRLWAFRCFSPGVPKKKRSFSILKQELT